MWQIILATMTTIQVSAPNLPKWSEFTAIYENQRAPDKAPETGIFWEYTSSVPPFHPTASGSRGWRSIYRVSALFVRGNPDFSLPKRISGKR